MDRRQFLKRTSQCAVASGLGALAWRNGLGAAGAPTAERPPSYHLPDHLPKELSIGMFIWSWITMATRGEPYYDLEQAVAGLPERGFNAVRAEAGLNWCFRVDGSRGASWSSPPSARSTTITWWGRPRAAAGMTCSSGWSASWNWPKNTDVYVS